MLLRGGGGGGGGGGPGGGGGGTESRSFEPIGESREGEGRV